MTKPKSHWYYLLDGERIGPIESSELKRLAADQEIDESTLIWKEGLGDWMPANKIKGLFPPKPTNQPVLKPSVPPAPPSPKTDFSESVKKWVESATGAASRAKTWLEQASAKSDATDKSKVPDQIQDKSRPPGILDSQKQKQKTSRVFTLAGMVGGGFLLMSCCMCGILGLVIAPLDSGSSGDVLKSDGTEPSREEISQNSEDFGPKPQYSSWDGSFEEIKAYLKDTLNDPASVEYVFWSKVVIGNNGWDIRVKYRGKNAFNATVTTDQIFTIRHGQVVAVRDR